MDDPSDRAPVFVGCDPRVLDGYSPSPFSLRDQLPRGTVYHPRHYPHAYREGKWKILMVATQVQYLDMEGGKCFSTGNNPTELLVPMLHLDAAGFDIDIATESGYDVHFEEWAFPEEDPAVDYIFEKYRRQFQRPRNLEADVWGDKGGFTQDTPYLGVFIPGGRGAMALWPYSNIVGRILRWAHANRRFVITSGHGAAALLAADINKPDGTRFIYEGYQIHAYPDALDEGPNLETGLLPGLMPFRLCHQLRNLGVVTPEPGPLGAALRDRYLITGDSPQAANYLGTLAALSLLSGLAERTEQEESMATIVDELDNTGIGG